MNSKAEPTLSRNAVYINVANRMLAMFGNLGVLGFVIFALTPEMQGFYYTFYSLIFLKFFAELGLNFAVVQIISHCLSEEDEGELLNNYIRFFKKWFFISSLILTVILLPSIFMFKNEYVSLDNYYNRVILPWFFLSLSTGLGVYLNGLTAILEGKRQIVAVSRLRLIYSLGYISVVMLGLYFGLELWSLALGSWVGVILQSIGLIKLRRYYSSSKLSENLPINWLQEVWPFQWRLAASWISGFFIFYCLTPLVLKYDGAVAAGQLGVSLQIFLAMNNMAILFISTHSSIFGGLVAKKNFNQMDKLFSVSLFKSTGFLILMIITFWIVLLCLGLFNLQEVSERLLTKKHLVMLTVACIGNHVFMVMNYYMRSFKDESIWVLSCLNAIATIGFALVFLPHGGVQSAIIIYTLNSLIFWVVIGLPYCNSRRKFLINPSPA